MSEEARIRELFAADGIAKDLGVELVDIGDASVTLQMAVTDAQVGWHGRCHGGVLFTLADIAMSYVGNRFPDMAYATHAAYDFVDGVDAGDVVTASAVEHARRGRTAVIDVTLRVDGRMVGLFRGNTVGARPKSD